MGTSPMGNVFQGIAEVSHHNMFVCCFGVKETTLCKSRTGSLSSA